MKTISIGLLWLCMFTTGVANAVPMDFSFTGNFSDDDDVQLFSFTVGAPSTVIVRTWSYAGGTNAAGNSIPHGGFDPIISLFDGAGNFIDHNDDGDGVAEDPDTDDDYDSLLEIFLAAEDYIAALTQYSSFSDGSTLGDGFEGSGEDDFDGRTSAWAVDILNVDSAAVGRDDGPAGVPEPNILALLSLGLVVLGFTRRRRKA